MPKPLLLARPSGPYVRFLIPADLRPLVGSRFIVRPLGVPHGDAARLVAARMGMALSYAFDELRRGQVVDLKKALEAARTAGRRDLTLERERLTDGTIRERWQMDTPEDVALFRQIQAADELEGIGVIPEAVALQQAAAEAKAKGPTLSEAIKTHLGDLERARRDQKTIMESRHSLRVLLGVVGDMPAADLGTEQVRAFLDAVRHWPRNASKREPYKGRTVRQVLKLSKAAGEPEPAAHTLNKHRQRLSVFLQHLLASRVLQHNPLQGVARMTNHAASAEAETGRPFTARELQAIFGDGFTEWASKYPHRWWGPMFGLYSGARVTEVGQLYLADFEEVDGVLGVHFARRFPGQKLKNAQSLRFVPIAQPLLDAGLRSYLDEVKAAGLERVFPHLPNSTGLGYGRQLSRQFSAYLEGLGIVERGLGFHGFRHTFATHLDRAGVQEADIGRLTGHGRPKSVLGRFYIDPPTLPERVETLAKFQPEVLLPRYTVGQFQRSLMVATQSVSGGRKLSSRVL